MRRAEGLVELSRRGFCTACAGTAVGIALVACTDNDGTAIQTGGLGNENTGPGGDLPDANDTHPPVDAAGSGSGSNVGTCTAGATDVGAPSAFQLNTPVYFSNGRFFVVKDSGGYYALTSLCTHEGAVTRVQSGQFYCPRHGAKFTFNGAVVSGPVSRALVHYAMRTLSSGNLGVTTTSTVSASTRLVV